MSIEMDKLYCFQSDHDAINPAIELLNLPSESDERSYYLKIFIGKHSKQTNKFKVKKKEVPGTALTPKWTIDLDLRDVEESKIFEVDVHCCVGKVRRSLGFYEAPTREIVIGKNNTINVDIQCKSSGPSLSLKFFLEDQAEITQSAEGILTIAPQPSPTRQWKIFGHRNPDTSNLLGLWLRSMSATLIEDDYATAGRVIQETPKPKEPSQWVSRLIDGVDTVETMIDSFKDVHPAASVAWGFISSGVKILKHQVEQDETVLQLYKVMILTYKEASNDHLLWQQPRLKPIYESLFHTTNECGMLIKRHMGKNHLKQILSLSVKQKAEELIQGFETLQKQLASGVIKDTLTMTLDVSERLEILGVKQSLQELRPKKALRPKSDCMPGTHVETINTLMSWIAECKDHVLWCSGLAGTGKSSLAGTLYELLTLHVGSRSCLAAFVRYDRTSYSDSSELFPSIAYSLGMCDLRIGQAIVKALDAYPFIATMLSSNNPNSHTQFQHLLQEPLEKIQDLQNESPLIVIIDGLDESDVSEDLLKVLADGFGPTLPFMRLIVFSRPEEKISHIFKKSQHVCQYPLDTSSEEAWVKYNEQHVVAQLAEQASGLFIWAATVCSFLSTHPSLKRLKALLDTTMSTDATGALMTLYHTTLGTVASEVSGRKAEDIQQCIRAILGALIVHKGNMLVPMLPALVLKEGDPPAQFLVERLGSVIKYSEKSRSLELIHKSFDDFLQDHDRCGKEWFIDVKEHEKEHARWCVLSLTMFFKNWIPPCALPSSIDICLRATTLDQYHHDVPSHIGYYAVNVLQWHLDALLELGSDTYHPLFEHYLFWLEILYAFINNSVYNHDDLFSNNTLLKVISIINIKASTHIFIMPLHSGISFSQFSKKYHRVNPAYVYTHAMSISPATNFLCRDWGQSSGVDAPFDKERLLALIPWSRLKYFGDSFGQYGSQLKAKPQLHDQMYEVIQVGTPCIWPERPFLFNVDTGRTVEPPSSPSILLPFPDLSLPQSYHAISFVKSIDANVQVVRCVYWDTSLGDKSKCSFNDTQYQIIERHDNDLQDAMISNAEDNNNLDSSLCSTRNKLSIFISIISAQTSCCDNYLLPAIGEDFSVVQYAHGLIVVDDLQHSGLMLKIEPDTTDCKKWMTLDSWENGNKVFAITKDGSKLLGLMGAAGTILLQEWETSTGTLCCEHKIYGGS
ncbi:hypothetical protein EDD18DRAFT_1354219 [Armillaria luteobubalina]|uniref:Nephrocystin 3-like N-terminal domain-containing protein n=1 Tax=Armillaria luteobubalina TaxID=153913 RepID=A0AA39TNA1_9AGAR|nr:hypothetical protein EDD18DRAFT_1354219 [Armillaria luteobubalina]